MKKVTIDELEKIYRESGFMAYSLSELDGVTALQRYCGSTVCEVEYYAITDEKAFEKLCEKVENLDNVARILNNDLVKLVEFEKNSKKG